MWKPWVGANYHQRRTLLLLESCYDFHDPDGQGWQPEPDHSRMIVQEMREDPSSGSPTMKKLTRAICGCEAPGPDLASARWDEYALTNYVPQSAGVGASARPSETAWAEAEREWPQLLNDLKPRTVIILGKTMWSRMPKTDKFVSDDVQGYAMENGETALCYAVHHPSRGGPSWMEYSRFITEAEGSPR